MGGGTTAASDAWLHGEGGVALRALGDGPQTQTSMLPPRHPLPASVGDSPSASIIPEQLSAEPARQNAS